jgi:hypothetical protein
MAGDLDIGRKDGLRTIVLRLNEACGHHTSARLHINLSGGPAGITQEESGETISSWLAFRRFGVKTMLAKEKLI